ncbi:MAG: TetR/AcrR family transcriptional regulator [Solirubrobacterales bacterium]
MPTATTHEPADQRARLREALLDLSLGRGYPDFDLEALLERAGVDGESFHRHFTDLDDCFCAILAETYDEFFAYAQLSVAGVEGWRDRIRATAYAMLRFLLRDERVAHLGAVDAGRGGKRAQVLFVETFERLVDLIDEGRGETTEPDSFTRATAVGVGGVIFARVQEAVAGGELELGEEELPKLMYAAVFPYLGAAAADEELHAPPPPDPAAPKG